MSEIDPQRVLVLRRDNIGDLVCTTPLFTALRQRFPHAWIGALVNSYNAPVLERNPDLSEVIAYRKLKHREPGDSPLANLVGRIRQLLRLRQMKLDWLVLAAPGPAARGLALSRWLRPRQIAGFDDSRDGAALDLKVPLQDPVAVHEVEQVFALARRLGFAGEIPPLVVVPDPAELQKANASLGERRGRRVALHISARRPAQRWPAQRYAELALRLQANYGVQIVLLWSPGGPGHPQHPGDDDKATAVLAGAGGSPAMRAYPTVRLTELIGMLAACDEVICSDGGAMHLAAALGKPIVALFGDSPVVRWRPWGVPHRIVCPPSHNLADASVDEVLSAYGSLRTAAK